MTDSRALTNFGLSRATLWKIRARRFGKFNSIGFSITVFATNF